MSRSPGTIRSDLAVLRAREPWCDVVIGKQGSEHARGHFVREVAHAEPREQVVRRSSPARLGAWAGANFWNASSRLVILRDKLKDLTQRVLGCHAPNTSGSNR